VNNTTFKDVGNNTFLVNLNLAILHDFFLTWNFLLILYVIGYDVYNPRGILFQDI
jgi:hypothetical protein